MAIGTVHYELGSNHDLNPTEMTDAINNIMRSSLQSFIQDYIYDLDPAVETPSIEVSDQVDPNVNSFNPADC